MKTKTIWLAVAVATLMPIVTGATPGSGVVFNIITRGTTQDAIAASGHVGSWNALVHTNRSSDFVVQDVALAPGGYSGWHAHTVQNESAEDLELLVTYITPVGAFQRIDAPHPDNCPSVP